MRAYQDFSNIKSLNSEADMQAFYQHLDNSLKQIKDEGTYKVERRITTPQRTEIDTETNKEVINLCANNYLGLADDIRLINEAKQTLDEYGFGMASVRFICGTQNIHQQLEARLSDFLGMENTILYSSCFDANTGLFETILGSEDAIISDALNHASLIDGIRLCKAKRFRYANNDMAELETQLQAADKENTRFKLIVTDGVFSMDGVIANLTAICDLADKYNAMVMVDDSHAVGFMGENGRGTHEYCKVMDRIDILSGTFGKALGGASGGYIAGKKPLIDFLRQRSRPYLFSNSVAPMIVGATTTALDIIEKESVLRQQLQQNTRYFRDKISAAGFTVSGETHPIVPVMIGDAALAKTFADKLLEKGIYVIGFSYPVVPHGQARIRTQISAKHTTAMLDKAISAFTEIGKELQVLK